MKDLFMWNVDESRRMVLRDDRKWYCLDAGEPEKLWNVASETEMAMAEEIKRLRKENATLRPTGKSDVWDDYCETVRLVTRFARGNPNLSDRVGAALAEIERLRAEKARKP